ncbi:biotin/lipoate A/B protein ligase [Thalassoporum mexicanum PCC 7367]|uniref:lipoate--protein ligase family protein n=1 Tax=Thalassoporum mexicanum TaxID=3457544 RepID=UPI00029F8F52|nr:lipoate--protein ligase family protein [Pseudanabaena sp. PCC 7367]AFY70652.1 biotin/lipoate A/B protein ligase [Pseudanabaena sp. PCC 7367]
MSAIPSPDLSWRLIPYQNAAAGLNMAIDRYCLNAATQSIQVNDDLEPKRENDRAVKDISRAETGRSMLRFYGWQRPTISLGHHQRRIPEHWSELAQELDLAMVRRPSGGRAVLHHHDLTYAIVTRAPFPNRDQTYRHMCEFLIKGLAKLGIEVNYGAAKRNYMHNPSCFNTATNADLVVADGRKLVGSAQVYAHGWLLQHGTIAIQPDYALLEKVFRTKVPIVGVAELLKCEAIEAIEENANSLNPRHGAIANSSTSLLTDLQAKLIKVLSGAASEHFQVELVSEPLMEQEMGTIAALEQGFSEGLLAQSISV